MLRHSCVFKRCWTQTAKWRSVVHVNHPFIFLITNVNHRKPGAAHTTSLQWAACLYARSHVVWRAFHLSLSVSHLCHQLCVQPYAYGVAARQHDAIVSRICYVWTHLICLCSVWGNRVRGLMLQASLACDGGYYMWATTENTTGCVNRRSLADLISEVTNKGMLLDFVFSLYFLLLL